MAWLRYTNVMYNLQEISVRDWGKNKTKMTEKGPESIIMREMLFIDPTDELSIFHEN